MMCSLAIHGEIVGTKDQLKKILSLQLTDMEDETSWKGYYR